MEYLHWNYNRNAYKWKTRATAHPTNMKSPHSRVSLAATAPSRTNAVLPVSYSAFIGVVTLQINDPVLAWKTQTLTPPETKLLWPFESRRNTSNTWQFDFRSGICFSSPPGSLKFCFHTKFCLCHWAKHQNDTAVLVWKSAALHSCTIKSVQPRAFSASHMTKRVRQKGEGERCRQEGDFEGSD